MQVNKYIFLIIYTLIFFSSCIESYDPDITEFKESLVINGLVTDRPGNHYVYVSRSVPYEEVLPFNPEENCSVKVFDDKGNSYVFEEVSDGKYACYFEEGDVSVGTKYKIQVITDDGIIYESDYDEMLASAQLGDITWKVDEVENNNRILDPVPGIRFYIDCDASGNAGKNIRWELHETWEYHAKFTLTSYYDTAIQSFPEDIEYSQFYCWKNNNIKNIYTLTTKNLVNNKITNMPINFVSNETNRLKYGYSLLVKQYSLTDTAFEYWNRLQVESSETGGLYETQPGQINGNIKNVNDNDELVLGFFGASSVTEKRIMVDETMPFYISDYECSRYFYHEDTVALYNAIWELDPDLDNIVYLINLSETGSGPWDYADQKCFDCTYYGGTTEKPEYWNK